MNLIVDKGNTYTKIALYDNNELVEKRTFDDFKLEYIKDFLRINPAVSGAILSSVTDYNPAIKKYLEEKYYFIELDENTPIPIKNNYKTPETLGKDRIAVSVGGKLYYSDKNLFIINTGTCITYNFINSENEFLGGAISPGVNMRLKALNLFTAKLPLKDVSEPFDVLIGTTTDECILSGVINGMVAEIEGLTQLYKNKYPKFKAILSGGDIEIFENKVRNDIFCIPDLVLTGLNVILDYNVSKKNIL